jgi:hypothetical protein
MALDKMSPEAAGGGQGSFQIYPAAGLIIFGTPAFLGFQRDISTEAAIVKIIDGQTNSVDGDRVAEMEVVVYFTAVNPQ